MKMPDTRVTNSQIKTFRRCSLRGHYEYREGFRPRVVSHKINRGSVFHRAKEVQLCGGGEEDWRDAARVLGRELSVPDHEIEVSLVLAEAHQAKWKDNPKIIQTEVLFKAPILHPDTWGVHPKYVATGRVDVIQQAGSSGEVILRDYKTTTRDASPGGPFYESLLIDPQISTYWLGVGEHAYTPVRWEHDVIRWPREPKKATPPDKRKYTKDGTMYKSQREHDEPLDEYLDAVKADLADRPDFYFQRIAVHRTEEQLKFHRRAVWSELERMEMAPSPNPEACWASFGTCCPFWDVCQFGGHPSERPDLYAVLEDVHPELA